MHLLDPLDKDYTQLSELFESIYKRNAIALLGAGASVTDKRYLSNDIIILYEAKISKSFGTNDIIQFVDILQSTPGLRRTDFDSFVVEQLNKLSPTDAHKIFVSIPWKQVITTNFDTLIEEASDFALKAKSTHYKLHLIRNKNQTSYVASEGEITYIKLNGCKTDLALYPLVFSTEDFNKQTPYYKKIISSYRQFSNEIKFISFGYSYSDIFSEKLLEKIASSDARQKRILYCVDPYVNEDRLDYLSSKQIAVIKLSFSDFFNAYQKWFENNSKNYYKSLQRFTNPEGSAIKLDMGSRLFLDNNIIQLKEDYKSINKIKKSEFYIGEEPTYQVILDNFDVVRKEQQEKLLKKIEEAFQEHNKTMIPKLLLVNGDFGTGKTTFTLRAINEYLNRSNNTIAFEITNPTNVRSGYLSKLIEESTATQFIFYCDNIETDSILKSFLELRVVLASEQNGDIKIVFLSSIRENILEKFKNHTKLIISNLSEIDYNSTYSNEELLDLIDNLKEVGLVEYRDLPEKNSILQKIKLNYKGDAFITLYGLITKGSHYKLLEKAYNELSEEVKTAFKITALIHRFNMLCPASLIVNSLKDADWNGFTDKVIKGDGKGILFQITKPTMSNSPDLYFKTKHPVIAEALIKQFFKNNEKNSLYKSIFESLAFSDFNAGFIVDLIKNIRKNDQDITKGQIENFFNIARKEFETSPHFMLAYITNIEKNTNSIKVLEKCIHDIMILEASLERRNHRLIHRKASIYFKIAKIIHSEDKNNPSVNRYLHEAEEWFDIKKHLDPLSSYSYIDYFSFLMWKLRNIKLSNEQKLATLHSLNTLFDEAYKTLDNSTSVIDRLFDEYRNIVGIARGKEYEEFLLERYQDVNLRTSAAILLYYYYEHIEEFEKSDQLFSEIEKYTDDKDVVYFLFKEYGRNLHLIKNRLKFFSLISNNLFLKEKSLLRYTYFNAVCEFYNHRWSDGWEILSGLKTERLNYLNPDFYLYWRDEAGNDEIFEAEIVKENKVRRAKIVSPFYKSFFLIKGNYQKYSIGENVSIKLRFFLDGVKAEIVDSLE